MKSSLAILLMFIAVNVSGQEPPPDAVEYVPEKPFRYDTVKCIVQCYSPNNGLVYSVPQFFAIKGWVVIKIVRRNNAEGRIDPYHDFGFKYQEWDDITPVKYLLPNKKTMMKDVWAPNGQPQYMLKDW